MTDNTDTTQRWHWAITILCITLAAITLSCVVFVTMLWDRVVDIEQRPNQPVIIRVGPDGETRIELDDHHNSGNR